MEVQRRVRILEDQVKYVVRSLPGKPKILVASGQQVSPQDVLAKSIISPGFRSINVAKLLDISPQGIKKYLKINLGQKIFKGELLAFKPRYLFGSQRIVTSPTDGVLHSVNEETGEVRLAFLPQELNIPAAFYGFIEKIDPLRGKIWIKTCVTQIFGLVGSGKLREGILKVVGKRGDLISKEKITSDFLDHIIVGGGFIYGQAIEDSLNIGAAGIITGSINAKDFRGMIGGSLTTTPKSGSDIGMSVLVMEGFGSIAMGADVYELFRKFDGKFAIIDGNRAEVLIPLEEEDCILKIKTVHLSENSLRGIEALMGLTTESLEIGQKVRVCGSSFLGEQGKVLALDKEVTILSSGLSSYLVTIETASRKIKVPISNIEII